jgi:hypothetical protein
MTNKRRGRVKGRALAKQINPNTSWAELFLSACYGEDKANLTKLVQKCLALEKRAQQLERLRKSFDWERHNQTVRRALEGLRGKKLTDPLSYVPKEVVRGARHDTHRDEDVYRYYAGLVEVDRIETKLSKPLGGLLVHAIRRGDYSIVRDASMIADRLRELESEPPDKLPHNLMRDALVRAIKPIDPDRALFLMIAGKDAEERIRRTSPYTLSDLARLMTCHKRTVDRLCKQYRVTLQKGSPGRPAKEK